MFFAFHFRPLVAPTAGATDARDRVHFSQLIGDKHIAISVRRKFLLYPKLATDLASLVSGILCVLPNASECLGVPKPKKTDLASEGTNWHP